MGESIKSLHSRHSELANGYFQLKVLSNNSLSNHHEVNFTEKLRESKLFPLKPTQLEIFQINVGKMCNQVCKHCHVDAGPDRKEISRFDRRRTRNESSFQMVHTRDKQIIYK